MISDELSALIDEFNSLLATYKKGVKYFNSEQATHDYYTDRYDKGVAKHRKTIKYLKETTKEIESLVGFSLYNYPEDVMENGLTESYFVKRGIGGTDGKSD